MKKYWWLLPGGILIFLIRGYAEISVQELLKKTAPLHPTSPGRRQTIPASKQPELPGMVYIPEGEFIMGSNEGFAEERPAHIVYLKGFYIDRYEVTNAQYERFCRATGNPVPPHWKNDTCRPEEKNYPVVNVSYYDALAYARWAGKRLPTEEEWEKAGRGCDGRIYPWGNEWQANSANVSYWFGFGFPRPVGSYPAGASPYGVEDLAGNVREWTGSYFLPYAGNSGFNPAYGKELIVIRGGSFSKSRSFSFVFRRDAAKPETRAADLGFRCAR